MLGVKVLEPAAKNGAKCRHRPGAQRRESGRRQEEGSRQQRAVSCCHDACWIQRPQLDLDCFWSKRPVEFSPVYAVLEAKLR